MLKRFLAVAAVLAVGSIAGCGGSGGSTPAATVSGTVADGYLVGAQVFMDKNGNYQWDEGEPKTVSGPHGYYTLSVAPADEGKYPIVVRVMAGSTVDEDDGKPVQSGYVLSAPSGSTGFISPMSSLIREKMAANPGMTTTDAMVQLRNQLNLPAEVNMLGDYVAGSGVGQHQVHYQTMRETARQMTSLMAEQAPLVMNGAGINRGRYRAMMGEINLNMSQITDNAMNGSGMDSAPMTAMRDRMRTMLQGMQVGGGFTNYSGMFRNMTSHSAFWNYTGSRWRPGGMMGSGMM
ncbi:MAG: hypothetical protein FD174_3417 [Geobacteraceae bacterium]|nr:MAG: hypothetical protein FD174_3417 [Geobacteraceae bacterium]